MPYYYEGRHQHFVAIIVVLKIVPKKFMKFDFFLLFWEAGDFGSNVNIILRFLESFSLSLKEFKVG